MAHLDVGGVDQRRSGHLAPVAGHPLHRSGQPASDAVVDDRQARGEAMIALPAHGEVLGGGLAAHARRAGAAVVGLELVDVGGEGTRRSEIPACSCSSSRGSSARRSRVRARSSTSRPSKVSPSIPSRMASGRPPRRGTSTGVRAARHSAAASGAQSHHIDGSATASTPRSSPPISDGEKEPHSSTLPRRSSALSCAAKRSGTSPRILMFSRASVRCAASIKSCGPLCG